jgi:hypothetical protein
MLARRFASILPGEVPVQQCHPAFSSCPSESSKVRPEPATRSFTVCDTITALCAANRSDASANVHRESLDQLVLVRIQAGQHRPDALLTVVHLWDASRHGQV